MNCDNIIDLPNEIIYLIAEKISDKRTFYKFGLCFPNIARLLKNKKQTEFAETFFKVRYDSFRPFEPLFGQYNINTFGKTTNFVLPRTGDFIHNLYLETNLPNVNENNCNWTKNIGYQLTNTVDVNFSVFEDNYINIIGNTNHKFKFCDAAPYA